MVGDAFDETSGPGPGLIVSHLSIRITGELALRRHIGYCIASIRDIAIRST